jgi:hypothetical protein
MVTESSRRILLMACKHELEHARAQYKLGMIDLAALRAVNTALEQVKTQIVIEADKK